MALKRTQKQALKWLDDQVGKYLDYDGKYQAQCVDFYNYYFQYLTGKSTYSTVGGVVGAKDIWDKPLAKYGFKKVKNNPHSASQLPPQGSILVFDKRWGGGYGHVDVARKATIKGGITAIGENEHGNPSEGVIMIHRSWATILTGLIGWWEPDFKSESKPKEKPSEPTKPKPKKDKPPKKTTPPAKPPVTKPEKPTEPPAKDEAPETPDNPPVTQSPGTPVEAPIEIKPGVQTWVKQDTPTPTPQVSWLAKLFNLLLKLLSKFLRKGK